MGVNRQISRLAKILVESEGITFGEAEARLSGLTLEVVVGPDAVTPAAHAAILTAVNVGHRTFIGGVRVVGAVDQPINSALPLRAKTLREAVREIGASDFEGVALQRIVIGRQQPSDDPAPIALWWDGWRAGVCRPGVGSSGNGDNPLTGIAAGALGVGVAFLREYGRLQDPEPEIDLWPVEPGGEAPGFDEVFLPGALWLVGLGNLGQGYLWSLASLPYADPSAVNLVLQDADRLSEENWGTSVLVFGEPYGTLKTKNGERFAEAKGFIVRRVDRKLMATDRLQDDDPRVAVSGLDRIEPRKAMGAVGFDCIVDAGLGHTSKDFERFRVTVFDQTRSISEHFADAKEAEVDEAIYEQDAYRDLEARIGRCGMAEIAGASAAVPFVSALAAAVVVARLIAIASGQACPASEVGKISQLSRRRKSAPATASVRTVAHAGRPKMRGD